MKKYTPLWFSASVTALLLLAAAALCFLLLPRDAALTGGGDALLETGTDAQTEAPATEEEAPSRQDHFLIWVGDSRTLGMEEAVGDGCRYIGAAGEGYDWFAAYGESLMREAIAEDPDAPVVFNLGVNDHENVDLYLQTYRALTDELSDTVFYFLSVNPIDPSVCHTVTNEQISDFNLRLREAFPDTYIDSYTYLLSSEISPFDGVHYSEEGYRLLHDYVVEQIQN